MLDGFMKKMPQPVCIIAHNGIRFDFPILQAELFRIGKVWNADFNLISIMDEINMSS
jgi:hypothetical protein